MTKFVLAGALLIFLVGVPAYLLIAVSSTSVIETPQKTFGIKTEFPVIVANPNGVRAVRATLRQGAAQSVAEAQFTPRRWFAVRGNLPPQTIRLKVSAALADGFKSGAAELRITAVSNDLRGKEDARTLPVSIVLEPPRLQVDGAQHYINLGGAELVTFAVTGGWTEAGVKVGNYRFRSFPLPGAKSPQERFSLFAYPYDLDPSTVPVVYARDGAGQEVTAGFWFKVFPKQWRRRELPLSDAFLQKVTTELNPSGEAVLDRFLKINRDMRRENNAALAALRLKTEEKFLWSSPFEQLSNSKVEAAFADYRSYLYEGRKVDEQVHLGFDLSKTAQSPVASSNSGRVVFAGPLGIYGNCVVVDHGYALQSIYAHLSSIGVKVDDRVARGQELGRSGATGLAGGDHLHYSMQVDGVQVNPIEWWDSHWIQDRIASKLPPGSIALKQ